DAKNKLKNSIRNFLSHTQPPVNEHSELGIAKPLHPGILLSFSLVEGRRIIHCRCRCKSYPRADHSEGDNQTFEEQTTVHSGFSSNAHEIVSFDAFDEFPVLQGNSIPPVWG
ncbi:MAG: hypothetical protein WCR20_17710, partial [Verrucomicrobiota bacterium]